MKPSTSDRVSVAARSPRPGSVAIHATSMRVSIRRVEASRSIPHERTGRTVFGSPARTQRHESEADLGRIDVGRSCRIRAASFVAV